MGEQRILWFVAAPLIELMGRAQLSSPFWSAEGLWQGVI